MTKDGFWTALDRLIRESDAVIDRPAGSAHPRYPQIVYPLDYGYLADTRSMDGAGIDLWRGSAPEGGLDAIMATVDPVKRDSEIKLLIGLTEDEKEIVRRFQNAAMMRGILIRREGEDEA